MMFLRQRRSDYEMNNTQLLGIFAGLAAIAFGIVAFVLPSGILISIFAYPMLMNFFEQEGLQKNPCLLPFTETFSSAWEWDLLLNAALLWAAQIFWRLSLIEHGGLL